MVRIKIISEYEELNNCAVALGNFDGIHIAHSEIISKCKAYADEHNILSVVLLFENHTQTVLENKSFNLLTPMSEKIKIIEELGVDFVFVKSFDEDTMKMSTEEFFNFLIRKMKAVALFAGYDYTFGYKASGNSQRLLELGEKAGIHIEIIDEIDVSNKPISSTDIRELVRQGKIRDIKKYLGRNYGVFGVVERGKQNGTKMGIPTANLRYENDKLLPPDGVYSGAIILNKKRHRALINIGKNPTFKAKKRTLEVHIPNFCEDIYKAEAQVLFDRKIREEIKFNSPEELTAQIKKDLKVLEKEI